MSPVLRHRFGNGLRLLVREVHTTPIVAVHFWCRVGSADESPALNGISHFFEHMFFKGTEKRGPLQMDREIKGLGGYNNAFTSIEFTAYYVVVPSSHFALAFDILLDAMRHSIFAPEEIERERQVILEEIKRKEDTPGACLFDRFQARVFAGSPYAQPVLGTPESLQPITREAFQAHLRRYYQPANICVAVAGDVEAESVTRTVGEATQDWSSEPTAEHAESDTAMPCPIGEAHREEKDVNQVYWILGQVTPGRTQRRLGYVFDVLSALLSGGRSSRLYQRLVERENRVTNVDAWHWNLARAGLFGIDAEFPPPSLEPVRAAISEELDRVRQETVSDQELERAKTRLTTGFAFGSETASNMAQTLGRHEILTSAEEALEFVRTIRTVSAEEILEAARAHLDPGRQTVCQIEPRTLS